MIKVRIEDLTDQDREGSVSIAVKDGFATVYYPGDTIDTPEVTAPVVVVRLTQFRIALDKLGLLSTINAAVSASDPETRVWWEYSVDVYSDNPRIAAMAQALSITPAQVKGVFDLAQTIRY